MIENREQILSELNKDCDEKYKIFNSGICPTSYNIIGVRTYILKQYAKRLAKDHWKENYKILKYEYYEEIMIKGLMIGYAKDTINEKLEMLKEFIPHIENWAECDLTCSNLKFINKNKEIVWKFLQKYIKSKKEFEVRFAVVILLDYYIDDNYIDKVINILNNIECNTYYVKMAVAWAISKAYIKYKGKTQELLKNNTIDDITYNMALQKIVDSYRVSDSDKKLIRSMRRKKKL